MLRNPVYCHTLRYTNSTPEGIVNSSTHSKILLYKAFNKYKENGFTIKPIAKAIEPIDIADLFKTPVLLGRENFLTYVRFFKGSTYMFHESNYVDSRFRNIPNEAWIELAKDPITLIRINAAIYVVDIDTFDKLIEDKDYGVKRALIDNPHLPKDYLAVLAEDLDEDISERALNRLHYRSMIDLC
jgi:hypothetical protein